jgi:hypothetical protein
MLSHFYLGEMLRIDSSESSFTYSDNTIVMQDFDYIIFEVHACTGATIALEHVPGKSEHQAYEVVFGVDADKGIAIRDEVGGENKQEAKMDKTVLDCNNWKAFWIYWDSKARNFMVGEGKTAKKSTLFTYTPSSYYMPNAVAFNSEKEGLWVVIKTGSKSSFQKFLQKCLDLYFIFTGYEMASSSGLSAGEAVGVVFGVLIGVALLAGVVAMVMKPELRHRATGFANDTVIRFTGNPSGAQGFDPSDIVKEENA